MKAIVYIVFFLVLGIFAFVVVKLITEWVKNNNSPRLSVDAKIVEKRRATHYHHNHGHHHHTHSYHITFETQNGERMELRVPRQEYDVLTEGDEGVLTYQGTRYLGFVKKN